MLVRAARPRLRSPHDREILRLGVPAFGALAAGPLYTLVDTAIVGHLGTRQLAALALAGAIVSAITQLSDFLSYTTTAQVARLHGAGRGREARGLGCQACGLSRRGPGSWSASCSPSWPVRSRTGSTAQPSASASSLLATWP